MKSDSQLISTIEHYPHPAYLKEIETDKFIACNAHAAKRWGLPSPDEFVGRTLHDLAYVETVWGRKHADMIAVLDFRIREEKIPVASRHAFLDANGDAQWVELIKLPVLSRAHKVIASVSYRRDLTHTLSYGEVFDLYRRYYDAHAAVKLTLAYFGAESCFFAPPTETQLRVFLAKAERYSAKQTARLMGISHRTVECHVEALTNKVVGGNLTQALSQVRHRVS
jgi:DNA-binding CsgD family transcriptional regulator